jgi:hypothetical protein
MRPVSRTERRPRRLPGTLLLLAAAGLVAVAACGPGRLPLRPPETGYGPDDYADVRDDWTRSAEDYHNIIEGRLFVSATYHAPAFRAAWLQRAAAAFGWDGAARARAERELEAESRSWYTFFLAVGTREWSWNRLDSPDTIWHVWLEDDAGRKTKAAQIERLTTKRGELAAFYPALDSFREAYLVRFPRPGGPAAEAAEGGDKVGGPLPRIEPGTRSFELVVTGAPAGVTLEWELATH